MDTYNLQKRLINFDLLRVAAMFGIVMLHYFTHGLYKHVEIYSGGGNMVVLVYV